MRKVKHFLVDLIIAILISLPCAFICDWIGKKGILDWLDILFGLAGVALLLLIAYISFSRWKKKAKITKILNTMTIVAIATTVIYGIFMLLEKLFPDADGNKFTGNWEQWFPVSISLALFLHMQEMRSMQSYKNNNDLIVAAECHTIAEAEAICTKLEANGIKSILVEKSSPMYLGSDSDSTFQVQVMDIESEKAKELTRQ